MEAPGLLWNTVPLWVSIAVLVIDMAIRLVALGVVPHNRRPSAAWGWLMVIFFFPVLGAVVFLVLGHTKPPESRLRKQYRMARLDTQDGVEVRDVADGTAPRWMAQAVRLNQHNGAFPLVDGNRLTIMDDYNGALQEMARQIRTARHYVHFQFYIAVADETTEPVIAALEHAHREGVAVRVLIDHLGSVGVPGFMQLVHRLEAAGIPWRRMLPVRPWRGEYQRPDLRNHRKTVVIDGAVAFTGSMNVIDRSYNTKKNRRRGLQWVGLMLQVRGPVVRQLDTIFTTDWSCEDGDSTLQAPPAPYPVSGTDDIACQVVPSGPGWDEGANLELFNYLFAGAGERITVCAPYFVPDESMFNALSTAVGRGVGVRLYLGEISNHAVTHHAQRSFYEMLIRVGVEIFLYPAPYILHSKFVLIDDHVAVVGSSNMDIRSFFLDYEVNLLVVDDGFVSGMDAVVDDYHRASRMLELQPWLERPRSQKYLDNIARLTSSLQ